MSGDVLERLAKLEAEATAGPWAAHVINDEALIYSQPAFRPDGVVSSYRVEVAHLDKYNRDEGVVDDDAEFIAAMRNAAPVLLDIAEKAAVAARYPSSSRTALADLRAALSRLDEVNLP